MVLCRLCHFILLYILGQHGGRMIESAGNELTHKICFSIWVTAEVLGYTDRESKHSFVALSNI